MQKKYIIKITAGLAAIALTIAGAWHTAGAVRENHYISVSTSQQEKQVIVLDAGHGGMSLNTVQNTAFPLIRKGEAVFFMPSEFACVAIFHELSG